mmetsp:Transcript_8184/g.19365  ORF Transcript_8184/g.19365 Transcript_8184/m.19365 type:complete len:219 (+) Transcript_8184:1186-1842(+)
MPPRPQQQRASLVLSGEDCHGGQAEGKHAEGRAHHQAPPHQHLPPPPDIPHLLRLGYPRSEAGDEGHVQEEPEDPGAGVEGGGRALDEDAEEGPERSRPADQDSGPCRARERQPRQEKQRAHRRLQPPGHPPVVPGSALQSRERSEQEDQQCGREHGCEGLGGSVRVPLKAVDGQGGKAGEERDMQGGGHTARREKDLGDRALERERGRRALARLHVA